MAFLELGRHEPYNLSSDVGESKTLADDMPEKIVGAVAKPKNIGQGRELGESKEPLSLNANDRKHHFTRLRSGKLILPNEVFLLSPGHGETRAPQRKIAVLEFQTMPPPPPESVEPTGAAEELGLLRRARNGDFEAFSALVDRFQRRVFAVARRIVGDQHDAEDVTQQTFLSVMDHLSDFREESSVATWILRIATNHALKVLRKRRGLPMMSLDTPIGEAGDSYAAMPHPEFIAQWRDEPARLAQQREVQQLIETALDELPEKYRVVFVLRDVEGLSVKETAQALGLSEANVKVRLLRARLDLRERLTRALGDEATRMLPSHDHDG